MRPCPASVAIRAMETPNSRELPRHTAYAEFAKKSVKNSGSYIETDQGFLINAETLEFVINIGLDVCTPFSKARQAESPHIDTRIQIFPKVALANPFLHITVGASNQMEIAADFFI